jgi:polyhydroxyalkanoate synthesis regulator phasin
MAKKRKPQDATMRNIRGKATTIAMTRLKERITQLERRVSAIEKRFKHWWN